MFKLMGKKLFSILLCLCVSAGMAFAQNMTVSGTVTSAEDGLPVIGASVFVQGTNNGVITDADGHYTLRNVPANGVLVFSCIGRETAPKLVTTLSKCSFGMFLMHLLFLAPLAGWVIGPDVANPNIPVWLAIPVIAVLTFLCSGVTTWLLSKIPGSKWVIGC